MLNIQTLTRHTHNHSPTSAEAQRPIWAKNGHIFLPRYVQDLTNRSISTKSACLSLTDAKWWVGLADELQSDIESQE
ncbi:MAG: hypothetical protein D9C04_04865 [Nitrosopumilus sp. B06]|nr:MAG: hypothetical protein D9C04_04865 [Nitrosopumilus sp. B06]